MDIEAAQQRRVQDRLWQDQPISRHYRNIGVQLGKRLLFRLIPQ